MKKSEYVRIITHVPKDFLEQVQEAVWKTGAGKMWNYSHCSFVMEGIWYFTPTEWANPAIWAVWSPEQVEEYHLEFTCHKDMLENVISELQNVHPYEEVPIFVHECLEYENK